MNPPFSPAQAGRSFVVNLDQSIPHGNCSQSTFELTILGSCLQNGLQQGFTHTCEFQPLSCQGTRTDICFIIELFYEVKLFKIQNHYTIYKFI